MSDHLGGHSLAHGHLAMQSYPCNLDYGHETCTLPKHHERGLRERRH
jgi:hypothetical protein